MEGVVKLFGIALVVTGAICFIKPNLLKTMADFFTKDKWLYVGAIIDLILGIIFLRAASQCAISWLITLFGALALAKAVMLIILGKQKIKSFLDSFTKKPLKVLRGYALMYIALGVMLIYAA